MYPIYCKVSKTESKRPGLKNIKPVAAAVPAVAPATFTVVFKVSYLIKDYSSLQLLELGSSSKKISHLQIPFFNTLFYSLLQLVHYQLEKLHSAHLLSTTFIFDTSHIAVS